MKYLPETKWFSSAGGSAIAAVIIWLFSFIGLVVTPEVATGIVIIGGLGMHYFTSEKRLDVAEKIAARHNKIVVDKN